MNYLFIFSLLAWQLNHQMVQPSGVEALLDQQIAVVDVRTPEEFSEGALPEAENVSVTSLSFFSEIQRYPKEEPIFIYCKMGGRSARAVLIMKSLGFEKIYELEGGYNAWKNTDDLD